MAEGKTVRDFKDFIQRETGTDAFEKRFENLSKRHSDFWVKLNKLGWAKKTQAPEAVRDIDAVAPLSDQEWADLTAEFRLL